jgi:hypothetical protein
MPLTSSLAMVDGVYPCRATVVEASKIPNPTISAARTRRSVAKAPVDREKNTIIERNLFIIAP